MKIQMNLFLFFFILIGISVFSLSIYYFTKDPEDVFVKTLFSIYMLCLVSIFLSIPLIYKLMIWILLPLYISVFILYFVSNSAHKDLFALFVVDFIMHILFILIFNPGPVKTIIKPFDILNI